MTFKSNHYCEQVELEIYVSCLFNELFWGIFQILQILTASGYVGILLLKPNESLVSIKIPNEKIINNAIFINLYQGFLFIPVSLAIQCKWSMN